MNNIENEHARMYISQPCAFLEESWTEEECTLLTSTQTASFIPFPEQYSVMKQTYKRIDEMYGWMEWNGKNISKENT